MVIACGFADARLDVGVQIPEPCPTPRSWSGRVPCGGFACRPGRTQVAERMGVGKSRVSQIERGRVSTREVLDRYVEALGGRLSLMADFGDELLRVG